MRGGIKKDPVDRFMSFVSKTSDGHWIWMGSLVSSGHGQIYYEGKREMANRISMVLFRGFDINSEDWVLHKPECKFRSCVNPDHLYIGCRSDNVRDSVIARTHNNAGKTHCPQGHEYTKENTYVEHRRRHCRKCNQDRRKQSNVHLVNNTEASHVPHL